MPPLHHIFGAVLTVWVLHVNALPAHAVCLDPPGDLNASGDANVTDVQCSILVVLTLLSDPPAILPGCLAGALDTADPNCSGSTDVADIILFIRFALSLALDLALDENGDQCVDACAPDCTGETGGNAVFDMCGTCDADPANDCQKDCNGAWGGTAATDLCGTCDDDPTNNCVPGCVGPDAGRHWRLLQNSYGASNWFVAEIEMAASEGGPDATDAGGTASASREATPAALAFDGNEDPQNNWVLWYQAFCCDPVEIGTDWVAWDFGAGNGKDIVEVRIKQFDDPAWMYASFKVQSSCDGVVWTDEWTLDNLPTDGTWGGGTNPTGGEEGGGCETTPQGCDPEPEPCLGITNYLDDGYCDGVNNDAACDYDGGDCCESTCVSGLFVCGTNGFNCLDPGACENGPDGCGPPPPEPDGKTCSATATLSCGDVVTADTGVDGTENIILYSCSTWWESGPEIAYAFTPTQTGEVTAVLKPLTGVNNLDLFLIEDKGQGCHADDCNAKELYSEITWQAEAGTPYFLVVDGFSEAQGLFELSVECP